MEEEQGRVIEKQVGTEHAGEMKEGEVRTIAWCLSGSRAPTYFPLGRHNCRLQRENESKRDWLELGRLGDRHFRAGEVKGREREWVCVYVCVSGWVGWVCYNIHIVPPSELSTLIRFFSRNVDFFS
jgi:hypothetical protein